EVTNERPRAGRELENAEVWRLTELEEQRNGRLATLTGPGSVLTVGERLGALTVLALVPLAVLGDSPTPADSAVTAPENQFRADVLRTPADECPRSGLGEDL